MQEGITPSYSKIEPPKDSCKSTMESKEETEEDSESGEEEACSKHEEDKQEELQDGHFHTDAARASPSATAQIKKVLK
jgi:hypothetical protein